jgi:hypothetical protein
MWKANPRKKNFGAAEAEAGRMTHKTRRRSRRNCQNHHFGNCPACRVFRDTRGLGQVLAHVHDQKIEIGEGLEPPPREGP